MQEAVPVGEGAMAAVIGIDAEAIAAVCARVQAANSAHVVAVANFNGPAQTVIAGAKLGVGVATSALKGAGARRVIPLPVSAPFHCSLMQPAQDRLSPVLRDLPWRRAEVPCISNVTAREFTSPDEAKQLLLAQVTHPVRFTEMVRFLIDHGVDTFVEAGPGAALS